MTPSRLTTIQLRLLASSGDLYLALLTPKSRYFSLGYMSQCDPFPISRRFFPTQRDFHSTFSEPDSTDSKSKRNLDIYRSLEF